MVANIPIPGHNQQITISAGTAFKFGFYAFWGFLVAGLIPWLLFAASLGWLASIFASSLDHALNRYISQTIDVTYTTGQLLQAWYISRAAPALIP